MPIVIDPPVSPPLTPPADDGSNLWEQLYEALGFHRDTDAENEYALRKFCEAWCSTLQPLYEVVRERPGLPPWAILLDPDTCPAESLPYLAQYVGAILTPQMDEAQHRAEIKAPTTWRRGQAETMRTALAATLTGTQRVVIRERTPEAPDLFIRVLSNECPDPARTEALAYASKVSGLLLNFGVFDGLTYADLNASYESYGEVDETFSSYKELLQSSLP